MALKLASLTVALNLVLWNIQWTRAGVISLGGESLEHNPHVSPASSFMHFHGPVEGPEYEVKVPHVVHRNEYDHLHGQDHENHGYTFDYVAHPKYEFSYGVEDYHTGDFHAQKESRDGSNVSGEYSVMEPGGTIRIVSYHADKDGFHATVRTSGHNDHSGATYGDQGHFQQAKGHAEPQGQAEHHELGLQDEHVLQDYPAAYPADGGY
ncbi:cuticle protein isoform X2 [Cephus cinctus]|uniref:Cuticle protein isoform X2 n=1 Tax=Cephus cinctus TaxID=211228 RepID=A0AAJ7BSH2_CEPCN|nr:cuticle protein isoform X2 [Cephus cinctus]